jgi:hypothetical protein
MTATIPVACGNTTHLLHTEHRDGRLTITGATHPDYDTDTAHAALTGQPGPTCAQVAVLLRTLHGIDDTFYRRLQQSAPGWTYILALRAIALAEDDHQMECAHSLLLTGLITNLTHLRVLVDAHVSSAGVEDYRSIGIPTVEDICTLVEARIGSGDVEEYQHAGITTVEHMVRLVTADVTPLRVADYQACGINNPSVMANLAAADVWPWVVDDYRNRGINDLAAVLILRAAGVTSAWAAGYQACGINDPADMAALWAAEVWPGYVDAYRTLGIRDLDVVVATHTRIADAGIDVAAFQR